MRRERGRNEPARCSLTRTIIDDARSRGPRSHAWTVAFCDQERGRGSVALGSDCDWRGRRRVVEDVLKGRRQQLPKGGSERERPPPSPISPNRLTEGRSDEERPARSLARSLGARSVRRRRNSDARASGGRLAMTHGAHARASSPHAGKHIARGEGEGIRLSCLRRLVKDFGRNSSPVCLLLPRPIWRQLNPLGFNFGATA